MVLVRRLGEAYLAGHSLEEGVESCRKLFLRGIEVYGRPVLSTMDILGEETSSMVDVERYIEGYSRAIAYLGELRRSLQREIDHFNIRNPFTVSVKPSAICLSRRDNGVLEISEETNLLINLLNHITHGLREGIPIAVDAEDHLWTNTTLQAENRLLRLGKRVDPALQACLNRTMGNNGASSDMARFFDVDYPIDKSSVCIRACRGIYREPKSIATTNPRESKERLYALAEAIITAGYYLGLATHDIKLTERFYALVEKLRIPATCYEYQGLKGVYSFEDIIAPRALERGETVRMYMPVALKEGDEVKYEKRRLSENPEIMANWMRDRIGRKKRQWRKEPVGLLFPKG